MVNSFLHSLKIPSGGHLNEKILVALIILIVAGTAGYIAYKRMSSLDRAEKNEILEQEVQQKKIEALEEQVSTLQEDKI